MKLIEHDVPTWGHGTRVLFLKSRHKDGFKEQREIFKITHSVGEFHDAMHELARQSLANERIYASACPRDLKKASRSLRELQMKNEYNPNPMHFYATLEKRWLHSLLIQTSAANEHKVWLFDFDDPGEWQEARRMFADAGVTGYYRYDTKSGFHVLAKPFNRKIANPKLLEKLDSNPLMLWGY